VRWQIEYRQDVEIISTEISGSVTLEGIKKVSVELIELAKQKTANRFITKFSDISQDISLLDIYNLPNIMLDLGMNISDKIAIVYPTDSPLETLFVFFDSRCFNSWRAQNPSATYLGDNVAWGKFIRS
jgi:hypothetical protein